MLLSDHKCFGRIIQFLRGQDDNSSKKNTKTLVNRLVMWYPVFVGFGAAWQCCSLSGERRQYCPVAGHISGSLACPWVEKPVSARAEKKGKWNG